MRLTCGWRREGGCRRSPPT
uniref:Uncharacterized protein n=1 Tax=Arundo donax TaxID=35708 RepID=A0A0A9EB62_ARUDO